MRDNLSKHISVYDFIERNQNLNVKYNIDDKLYNGKKEIPNEIMDREVYDWCVHQWEGIINIKTNAGFFESELKKYKISFEQFSSLYSIWDDLSDNEKMNVSINYSKKMNSANDIIVGGN